MVVRNWLSGLVFSSILASGLAVAAEPMPLSATSAAEFRQQAAQIRQDMQPGGQYAKVSTDGQTRVGKQLDVLQKLYDNRAEGKSFKKSDEVKLVNASEEINAILSGREDDRLVCEQVRKLGSNRTEKVCMTVAERRARQDEAKKDLRNSYTGAVGGRD